MKMLEYVLLDRKSLVTVLGYPKMGRRGVIESILEALKTNPPPSKR